MMYVIRTKTGCELSSSNALQRIGYIIKTPEKLMNIHNKEHGGSRDILFLPDTYSLRWIRSLSLKTIIR